MPLKWLISLFWRVYLQIVRSWGSKCKNVAVMLPKLHLHLFPMKLWWFHLQKSSRYTQKHDFYETRDLPAYFKTLIQFQMCQKLIWWALKPLICFSFATDMKTVVICPLEISSEPNQTHTLVWNDFNQSQVLCIGDTQHNIHNRASLL